MTATRSAQIAATTALLVVAALICTPLMPARAAAAPLTGTLQLTKGSCAGGKATGTYIRMILPSGTATGPYLSNSDSTCSDQSYTPLDPGTDGGLTSGGYQALPSPAFDANGNALARRITQPAQFYGTGFATATQAVDPQTKGKVPVPTLTAEGSRLTADLRSFSVAWNNQYFNQGAPKPDGSFPGNTRAAKGTYDAKTGKVVLQWTSQVVGGPFDKFTGLWHLEGTFVKASAASAPTTTTGQVTGGGTTASQAPGVVTGGQPGTTVKGTGPKTTTIAGNIAPTVAPGSTTTDPVTGAAPALAASTHVTTRRDWQASWWLIALAIAIAVIGFGGLAGIQRSLRKAPVTP